MPRMSHSASVVVQAATLEELEELSSMEAFRRQGLVRPREGRILAGVCAGLARRFGIGPWAMRILFIVTLIVIPGSQIIIYPILWILMPSE
jgi:phage shock protein C